MPPPDRRTDYARVRGFLDLFILPLLDRAIRDALAAHLPAPPGRVLDVGCGRQPFRPAVEARGLAYTGLDVEQNQDGTVDVVASLDGPLPDDLRGRFDAVLCTEVLEHVADWPAAFANLAAVLRPGGRAVITCPFVFPLHELPHDHWRPTPFALRRAAERVGLAVVRQDQLGTGWDVLGTVAGALLGYHLGGPRPATQGPFSWAAAQLTKAALAGTALLLNTGAPARLVRFDLPRNPLYLSNLLVAERPASSS